MSLETISDIKVAIKSVYTPEAYREINAQVHALINEFNTPEEYREFKRELREIAYNNWAIWAAALMYSE